MKNRGCIFCRIIAFEEPGIEIFRDETCVALMDIFPLSPGHLMIIPLKHHEFLHEMSPETRAYIFEKASMLSRAVCRSGLKAKGVNLLLNNGGAANQHIPHFHLHVIPRYGYDLHLVFLRLLTRFINPFARIGLQKRLSRQAEEIRSVME